MKKIAKKMKSTKKKTRKNYNKSHKLILTRNILKKQLNKQNYMTNFNYDTMTKNNDKKTRI